MSSNTTYFCDICGKHIPNRKNSVDIDLRFGVYDASDVAASLDLCAEHLKEYTQLVEKVSQDFQEWLDQRR